MGDLFLSYYANDTRYCRELDLFFEYQGVIQEDLKRIYRLVERNYPSSEEKESLLFQLKLAIKDVVRNRFKEDPEMELNIKVYDNYLVFSYYKFNDEGKFLFNTPSIVIVTRDMKNLYFIDEEYSVFYEDEQEDDNRGHDEIVYFKLSQDDIKEYRCMLDEYTFALFNYCFAYTCQMINKIEEKGEFVFGRNAWFVFYKQYEEMYNQVCTLIHRDYEVYYERKYLDDGFKTGEEKALGDKHDDILNILKKMIYMLWNCWEYTKIFRKDDLYMLFDIVKLAKSEGIRYAKNIFLDEEYQKLCRNYTNSR